MIKSKADYSQYLKYDLERYSLNKWFFWMKFKYPTIYFTRCLRRVEYFSNCRPDLFGCLLGMIYKFHFRLLSIYLGFTIPPNTCGAGLKLNHWGTIVISPSARIGKNAHINVCVNIGVKGDLAPVLGDNVYIGPGAKLFGGIKIGSEVTIGANAVVNKSFPSGVTIVGVPARIVRNI